MTTHPKLMIDCDYEYQERILHHLTHLHEVGVTYLGAPDTHMIEDIRQAAPFDVGGEGSRDGGWRLTRG